MDENEVASLLAKTLQWASDRASSPAFINFTEEEGGGPTVSFIAVPGDKFIFTVEKVDE